MNASIVFYFSDAVSTVLQYPRQALTECWPWIIVGAGALAVAGLAAIKIWSRVLSVKARELAKPIVEVNEHHCDHCHNTVFG